jgi:hypothetical protein
MASNDEQAGRFKTGDEQTARARPARGAEPDTRKWGYDPDEDIRARGVAQDERQFGEDSGRAAARSDEPAIDAERDPGRTDHLALGSGGGGDWAASAYGTGLRRGPGGGDVPFRADPAFGSDRWRADQPPQARFGMVDAPRAGGTAPPADAAADGADAMGGATPGPERSDERLQHDLSERLTRGEDLDTADVSVDVIGGQVTLHGTVVDRHMKHAIEERVDGVAGVNGIDNRIKVMRVEPDMPGALAADAPPSPHASVPQDSPTARDEARGIFSEPMAGGAGKNG